MKVFAMVRPMLPALLMAALSGCATSTMKSTPFYGGSQRVYTGRVEDRVNLWPFAYYREPALSVLWPVFSQTDDHLAVRPFYSQYRQGGKDSAYDEFNFLWPLCQFDTKHDEHRIFPVFWGRDYFHVFPFVWNSGDTHCLFPLVWWREGEYFNVFPLYWNTKSTLALLPLFITGGGATYVFPSFFRNENLTTFFPFYGRDTSGGELTEWFGPLGYHRGKENSNWFLPFYYQNENRLWTPFYGHDRSAGSSWALPLYYKDRNGFYSLPWISSKNSDDNDVWISPLLLSGGERGADKATFLSPFWYSSRDDKANSSFWAVPPLLSWGWNDRDGSCDEYLLGFAGRGTDADGRSRYWTFPIFYHDYRTFLSTFWCAGRDDEANSSFWAVPPLLSWGSNGAEGWSQRYLLGLAGVERKKDGGCADWLAPLYYRDNGAFYSIPFCSFDDMCVIPPLLTVIEGHDFGNPLFGWCDSCNWCVPLWYKDDRVLMTLPYSMWWDANGKWQGSFVLPLLTCFESTGNFASILWGKTYGENWLLPLWWKDERKFVSPLWYREEEANGVTYAVPPLLSWMKLSERGDAKLRFLLGLGGVNTRTNGEIDCSWAFPFFYCDDRGFVSLPFAHLKNDATFVTPFVGVTHREHEKGAWLWPIGGWTNDDRMEAAEAQMNADRLDSEIGVEKREVVLSKDRTHSWHEVTGGIDAHDSSWLLSGLSTGDRRIGWSADDEAVTAKDESDFGNIFAYKRECCRSVKFDVKTREKLSDEEKAESGVFCNFLWHSKHEASKGHEYDMKSILWRFWHYENLNGDVSVDSFPFFTYDSKTDGYSKTSLMWRLFRNEYDPKTKRRSVDILFVPVWR